MNEISEFGEVRMVAICVNLMAVVGDDRKIRHIPEFINSCNSCKIYSTNK